MARDTLRRRWLLPAAVVAALGALTVTGARLHAQSCGGTSSPGLHASGSTYPEDRGAERTPAGPRGSSGPATEGCPLEPASLARLARDLDLDSRQYDTVARVQQSYVDRVSSIEGRLDADQQELVRVLDSDRVDAKRARRLVSSIGQAYTDIQQARLEAYLQMQNSLDPDQVRRLPLCPYLTSNTWGDDRAAGAYKPAPGQDAPEPSAAPPHQHEH